MSRHSDLDPFSTPPRFTKSVSSTPEKVVPMTKSAIITIIQNNPFDKVFLPEDLVNDDPNNFTSFIEALGATLIEIVISKSPRKMSPRKLVAL